MDTDLMWFLESGAETTVLAREVLSNVSKIALIIGAACFIITIVFDWLDNSLKAFKTGAEKQPLIQLDKLVKGAIMIGLIAIYPLLSGGFMFVVKEINKMTQMEGKALSEYTARMGALNKEASITPLEDDVLKILNSDEKTFNKTIEDLKKQGSSEKDIDRLINARASGAAESIEEEKTRGFDRIENMLSPRRVGQVIIGGIIKGLISIIRFVIKAVAIYLFQILLIFGSLAIAFSLLKAFENTFEIWFKTTLTTGLAITTMNVLDHITNSMMSVILSSRTTLLDSTTALNIEAVMIICYISTFWITGKYVAKTDAGGFLTKVVAISSLALKAATSAASGSVSGSLSGVKSKSKRE